MMRVIACLTILITPTLTYALDRADHSLRIAQSSEVTIPQVRGRMPAKGTQATPQRPSGPPEGTAQQGAEANAADRPITCTSANASSPACYSATQQGRPGR